MGYGDEGRENVPPAFALPEIVGEEFVGRREELAYLRRVIGRAPRRQAYSIALVARKGMGKTALLQRFFNLIFFDREFGVAPIYLSLAQYRADEREGQPIPRLTIRDFCDLYFTTYVQHLLAYRTGDAELVRSEELDLEHLATLAQERGQADLAADAVTIARQLESGKYRLGAILKLPSLRAYDRGEPIVYMIDEFQVVHGIYTDDKQHVTTIKEDFQPVAEARWAPLIVSGSIVSLVTEIVFSGLLARRFGPFYLYELKPDEAHELITHLSRRYELPVSPEVGEAMMVRTGGHPLYIWALLNSPALDDHPEGLTSLAALDQVFQFELYEQMGRIQLYWSENFQDQLARVNAEGLGEAILYWIASGEIEGEATPWKLVPLLQANRFDDVSEREVADKLRELYQIDLLAKGVGLHTYVGLRDSVMEEYIHRNYYRDILRWSEREIENSWRRRYFELLGKTNYFKGRVAEGYVRELMCAFDGREVEGETYFGVAGRVRLPAFSEVRLRGGTMRDGRPVEIDVIGEGGPAWLVEVKYREEAMTEEEARAFVEKAGEVAEAYGYETPVLWAVSRAGFTPGAEGLLAEQGVLRSDVEQFNGLASLLQTLLLPECREGMT